MARRARAFAVCAALSLLTACGDPGSAVDGPPPKAVGVEGAPAVLGAAGAGQGRTLAAVRARGYLVCGVQQGLIGFAYADNTGRWRGFDTDFCRATAAAIFGRADAARFVPTSSTERLTVLQAGEADVLWRNTSATFSRDAKFDFAGVNYYDGQAFMVRRALGVTHAAQLNGARVCIQTGSTSELNLTDYFRAHKLTYEPVVFDTEDKARAAYGREQCDVYTADLSNLAAARATLARPDDHLILPEVISKEPLGPVVRQGDDGWGNVVRWTLNAMILAEELGVTSANVDAQRQHADNPEIRRLLGAEPGYGAMIGLSDDFAYQLIKQVGNYGEVFDRNLGAATPLKIERGLNGLWSAQPAGLIYAPPMR
ncbi:amino acid ABC transporter substrate-binding protein [Caulobacter sp. 602-1]|uniref:amino acid ABC transporter substrate-binding protein n=1 Tax=Caulobacter sp. 602-1 TaxID=2492472 RepID=UPI001F1F0EB2|nr:amino acid ABC transporter substrate-binding protein [Caulobacter sp. 602-1]